MHTSALAALMAMQCVLAFQTSPFRPSVTGGSSTRWTLSCRRRRERLKAWPSRMAGDDMAGRGDLEDGRNADRNQKIEAIKRSFYSIESDKNIPEAEQLGDNATLGRVSVFGVLSDMPLCRWEMTMLPGYNNVLNVWQPMYTHLFESVIAQPKPWYYVHLQTPGGTKNLMNEDFALDKPDTKTPRVGVLMRIVDAQRGKDSRLACVVQGVARVRVLEQTRKEPFTRAHVQLLPDDEVTRCKYPLAQHALGGDMREGRWLHSVAHAAAVASEMAWLPVECAPVALTDAGVSQLVAYSSAAGAAAEVGGTVRGLEEEAARKACEIVRGVQQAESDGVDASGRGAPVLSSADLALAGVLGGGLSDAHLPAWEGWQEGVSRETPAEIARSVLAVEEQLWVEVDGLIRRLQQVQERAARLRQGGIASGQLPRAPRDASMDMAAVPVPSQLLGLLPPPPVGGWPEGFMLEQAAEGLQGQLVGTASLAQFVRVGTDPSYDPLRRAQRLSYVAATLVGMDAGQPAQALLEARSTQHRLAMILNFLVHINKQL